MLLKLKSKEFLDSENEKPELVKFRRKYDKTLLLDLYIEYIQQKSVTKQDEKLMRVLGFKDAFKIITDAKAEKIKEKEIIDQAAFRGAN